MSIERPSPDLFDVLKCPITYELFRDPVIGSDGHTYERENITAWIQKHSTSPITREPMDVSSLRSNYTVKKLVDDFVSSSRQKQYEFRLNIDVAKAKARPIFQSANKTIYEGQWKEKQGPSIVLINIDGGRAKREASFYVKLSCHPHIVRTYGLIDSDTSDSIMLVQEYAPQGDLRELLHQNNFRPNDAVFVEIFSQIVDAMICLADNQIVHGDLACRNVLVFRSSPDRPSEMLVKLTDFGLTRTSPLFAVIDAPGSTTTTVVPVRQAAPEILADPSSASYSEKSDVYSFGVLMWEAYSYGAVPYRDLKTLEEVYEQRRKGKTLAQPSPCPGEVWDISVQCMQHETSKRPTFKMVHEALMELKFSCPDASSRRTSTIRFNAEMTNNSLRQSQERTHRQIYNEDSRSKKNSTYRRTHRVSAPHTVVNSSSTHDALPNDSTIISCGYYMPCEYCLQSIGVDGFDAHVKVCPIRRLIIAFVQMVVRLAPLDITSCSSCDELIPVNQFRIHQATCNQHRPYLSNRSLMVDSTLSANATFTYLHPIPMQDIQKRAEIPAYANITPEGVLRPASHASEQSDFSDESPSIEMYTSAAVIRVKPPKSGFRKALSKLKKKM